MILKVLVFLKRKFSPAVVRIYRGYVRMRHGSRTVGGVCIIIDSSNRILLVKNSYEPGWGLPGGFFHRKEIAHQGVTREVMEETGIAVDLTNSSPTPHIDRRRMNVTFIYSATLSAIPRSTTNDRGIIQRLELVDHRWFSLHQKLPYLKKGTTDLLAAGGFHQLSSTARDLD